MIKRVIPNNVHVEFFNLDQEWEYFSNRCDDIPLRWSNLAGNYYEPLVKRRNRLSGCIESLCPYCHFTTPEEAIFLDDSLFLSYQYHLWEEHLVSIKGSSEAAPFIFQKRAQGAHVLCQRCGYSYGGARLDFGEYIAHAENCRSQLRLLPPSAEWQFSKVRLADIDQLVLYDQECFDLSQDMVITDDCSAVLGKLAAQKAEAAEKKKKLAKEKYEQMRKNKRRK